VRFAEAFGITRSPEDDWFDVHLTVDTKLFVDPLLLLLYGEPWASAHVELIAHFAHCYTLVAKATSPSSPSAVAARRLLTFPEPSEFGLGYTAQGTAGAGSGDRYARQMMDGIAVAIARGLRVPEHIEEVGILNEGIGADRISDAVCNVLKHRLIAYTQNVASRHDFQMELHRVRNIRCVPQQARWMDGSVALPTNPVTGRPIILVPQALLNSLPVLNADDWFNSHLNTDIRTQMNINVGQQVRKRDIVAIARRHPERVRQWAREQSTRRDLAGYDFDDDRRGVVQWDGRPVTFAQTNPIHGVTPPADQEGLSQLVAAMLGQFKHFIEDQRGWSLLWNSDGTEKPEEAAQLVFLGMAQHYLRTFNVEVDREVELGRGPVDFKVASGADFRLLIEVKKAHNGKFWLGLSVQLASYLVSDDCGEGWFVAIRYRDNKGSDTRMSDLPGRVGATAQVTGKVLSYLAVDARPKESASRQMPSG
jgi:hypothetical protein